MKKTRKNYENYEKTQKNNENLRETYQKPPKTRHVLFLRWTRSLPPPVPRPSLFSNSSFLVIISFSLNRCGDGDGKMIRLALYLMRKRRRDEEEEQGLEEDRRRKFVVISGAIAWHVLYSSRKKKARRGKDICKRDHKR
jgi:hypothetical protein